MNQPTKEGTMKHKHGTITLYGSRQGRNKLSTVFKPLQDPRTNQVLQCIGKDLEDSLFVTFKHEQDVGDNHKKDYRKKPLLEKLKTTKAKQQQQNIENKDQRDGLMAKNTDFSCRGLEFGFQHPHSGS